MDVITSPAESRRDRSTLSFLLSTYEIWRVDPRRRPLAQPTLTVCVPFSWGSKAGFILRCPSQLCEPIACIKPARRFFPKYFADRLPNARLIIVADLCDETHFNRETEPNLGIQPFVLKYLAAFLPNMVTRSSTMQSFWWASACCLMFVWTSVRAQGDTEPKVRGKTASEWITLLRTAKPADQRRAAVIALGILGAKQLDVVPSLAQAVNDADELVRITAIQTLGGMEQDARGAVDVLAKAAVHDGAVPVREASSQGFGESWEPSVRPGPKPTKVVLDPDPRTRAAAAIALADVKADPETLLPASLDRSTTKIAWCASQLNRSAESTLTPIGPAFSFALRWDPIPM